MTGFIDSQSRAHPTPDRHFHLKALVLKLEPDFQKKECPSQATWTCAPIRAGIKTISFDAVDLQIKKVTVDGRKAEVLETADGIDILLPRAYPRNKEFKVQIDYLIKNPIKGMYFVGPSEYDKSRGPEMWTQGEMEEGRYWVPCQDAPNQKSTFDISVTVPKGVTARANGRLVDTKTQGKKQTFRFLQEIPQVNYLLCVTCGKYEHVKDSWKDVEINYYAPNTDKATLKRAFGRTPQMMDYLSRLTGCDYPYPKYDQVVCHDFVWGGMENTTITTMLRRILQDDIAFKDGDMDSLVCHELVHQWFGDLITCKNWEHIWLNEGFASYLELTWEEEVKNTDAFHEVLLADRDAYFAETANYTRPIVTRVYSDAEDMFDRHSYQKAALTLHMLRAVLGEDNFWDSVKYWVKTAAGQSVETSQFRIAFEEATGLCVDEYFDQWVYKPGHLKIKTAWHYESDGTVHLNLEQIQNLEEGTLYQLPLEIDIADRDGRITRHQVQLKHQHHTFVLPCKSAPKAVMIDPEGWILLQENSQRSRSEWQWMALNGPRIWPRVQAITELKKSAHPEAIDTLAQVLHHDPVVAVRQRAAAALGGLCSPEVVPILLKGMKDKSPKVRASSAQALIKNDEESAGAKLWTLYKNEKSYATRATILQACGKFKVKAAFPELRKAFREKSWGGRVAAGALLGLVEAKDSQAGASLLKAIDATQVVGIRTAAAGLIKKAKDTSLFKKSEDLKKLIKLACQDRSAGVRRTACAQLAMLGGEDAPTWLGRLEHDHSAFVRRSARQGLKKLGGKGNLDQRVAALEEENRRLRSRLDQVESTTSASPKIENKAAKAKTARGAS